MRWTSLIAAAAVLATLTACGGANRVTGQVRIDSDTNIAVGQDPDGNPACKGAGGYEDIIGGDLVTVRNGEGKPVAETRLSQGVPSEDGTSCTFTWDIQGLPEFRSYTVQVEERDPVPYTLDELKQADFKPVLVLQSGS